MGPVVVIPVQPRSKGGPAGLLAGIPPPVGPALDQGAVESLDLAVSLGPIGPGPLVGDPELLADLAPLVAAVAAAVVGQHPLDDHPAVGEPGVGSGQEPGRRLLGLVGVDLGIGQPGVVIDGGVDEPMASQRVMVAAAAAAGAVGLAVGLAGGPAQEPVATTSGDVAQLLDIDVDQVAGMGVFLAADHLAGGPVQITQAAAAAADQDAIDAGGASPTWGAIWAGPNRWRKRSWTIRRTSGVGVRRGECWGGWTDPPSQLVPAHSSAGPSERPWVG